MAVTRARASAIKGRNDPRLRKVPPVFLGHFGPHRVDLQPRGIEDVGIVCGPKFLQRVARIRPDRSDRVPVQSTVDIGGRHLRRDDGPVHVTEPIDEEIGDPLLDPVIRLEPGGEVTARRFGAFRCGQFAEPDEGVHLVDVAADLLRDPLGASHHRIGPVRQEPLPGLEPVEKRVSQGEPLPGPLRHHRLRERREGPWDRHALRRIGQRIPEQRRTRLLPSPVDRFGIGSGQLPGGVAPRGMGPEARHPRRVHCQKSSICFGLTNRARRSAASRLPLG